MFDDLVEVEPGGVTTGPHPGSDSGAVRLLEHRGASLPLFSLGDLLGLDHPPGPKPKAIIVKQNQQRFAFQVDRMLGQQEVVVRPLKDPLVEVPGVSGSTDLGDGQPTLVLDLLALLTRASPLGAAR